jgi:hypothetical protein
VFVAANTLFLLPSQEQQLRCFANAATRLSAGGVFVIEVFVPDPPTTGTASSSASRGSRSTRCC